MVSNCQLSYSTKIMRFRGNFQVPSPLGLKPVGSALGSLLRLIEQRAISAPLCEQPLAH